MTALSIDLQTVALALMAAGLAAVATAMVVYTELSQFLKLPPSLILKFLIWRRIMIWLSAGLFGAGAVLGAATGAVSVGWMVGLGLGFAFTFYSAFVFIPYKVFRARQHDARYLTIPEIDANTEATLSPDDPVLVVEINGDARAFPQKWIGQPHIAGDTVGGEDVVMTYCMLSHLGVAYSPSIDGRKMNLRVIAQMQNNLVFYDTVSGQPVRQFRGVVEGSGYKLKQFPAQLMPWRSFRELYPGGKVLFNPPQGLIDRLWAVVENRMMPRHFNSDWLLFKTMGKVDGRLPAKEKVWGLAIDGHAVAWTLDYLRQHSPFAVLVGGTDVVMVYDPRLDTVSAFAGAKNGNTVVAANVDILGHSPAGDLDRLPVYSAVLWMIWSNFCPDTELHAG